MQFTNYQLHDMKIFSVNCKFTGCTFTVFELLIFLFNISCFYCSGKLTVLKVVKYQQVKSFPQFCFPHKTLVSLQASLQTPQLRYIAIIFQLLTLQIFSQKNCNFKKKIYEQHVFHFYNCRYGTLRISDMQVCLYNLQKWELPLHINNLTSCVMFCWKSLSMD